MPTAPSVRVVDYGNVVQIIAYVRAEQQEHLDNNEQTSAMAKKNKNHQKSIDNSTRLESIAKANQEEPLSFLKLPAEIRNRIYGHLLVRSERDPNQPRSVLSINALQKRTQKRKEHELRHGQAIDCTRCKWKMRKNVLLDVTILRVCRQTYAEGMSVLYGCNIFAINIGYSQHAKTPFHELLPQGMRIDLIRQLDIYHHFEGLQVYQPEFRHATWASFDMAKGLKTLRVAVTFDSENLARRFNEEWFLRTNCVYRMRELISAMPKGIKTLKWGSPLSSKRRERAGVKKSYAKKKVLKKIYSHYKGLQGADTALLREIVDSLK